ncbi:MAG: hypothetical protein A2W00_05945 [Candidatus Eisenbacteria bacterium RBG_16_71_46]|nr:MAG: hypothetical protein A2W00_05945 [Candidatus Eisenbacteria bacterium RBG_16_71_46]OGF20971.1 MAG: hypothetical protein A2V63_06085 [Candidatus Eisenbacteria bacterium RBG_19FT_COMBO_70_11]
MPVDQVSGAGTARADHRADALLDGLFTGMIGALVVAVWFLVLDLINGQPLYTPSLLGSVLLHGKEAVLTVIPGAPLEVAVYTAFHFVTFVIVGVVFSYLMTMFERFPIMFFVLLVMFLGLTVGFFVLDIALGAQLTGRLSAWSIVIGNLLASAGMVFYQGRRHPGLLKSIDRLWEDPEHKA